MNSPHYINVMYGVRYTIVEVRRTYLELKNLVNLAVVQNTRKIKIFDQ